MSSKRIIDYIQLVSGNVELPFRTKLTMIAKELSIYFNTEIYFCKIKGKRWSFVAGSGDTVYGSNRFQLNETWGVISDRELPQDDDTQLIYNMIRGMLTD